MKFWPSYYVKLTWKIIPGSPCVCKCHVEWGSKAKKAEAIWEHVYYNNYCALLKVICQLGTKSSKQVDSVECTYCILPPHSYRYVMSAPLPPLFQLLQRWSQCQVSSHGSWRLSPLFFFLVMWGTLSLLSRHSGSETGFRWAVMTWEG